MTIQLLKKGHSSKIILFVSPSNSAAFYVRPERCELIKLNKKVRGKERKHTLDQENYQEKNKGFILKNSNQFYFEPLLIVSDICRIDQIEYI